MHARWLDIRACHLSERGRHTTAAHRHRDPQWHLCVAGALTLEVDGTVHRCAAGEHVLVSPWRYRRIVTRHRCTILMLRFRSSCIDTPGWADRVAQLPETVADDLREVLARLEGGSGAGDPTTEVLLLRLLLAAQAAAAERRSAVVADRLAAEDLVAQAEAFIRDHHAEDLTRRAIAAACHCSPTHLGRLCRDRRGRTPRELVTDERMRRARELLLHDRRSIGAIAGAVGYATASHFGVVFKHHHGMTPRAFRRGAGRLWWYRRPVDGGPLP